MEVTSILPEDPSWVTWCDERGFDLVEEDPRNRTRVYVDGEGRRHRVVQAEMAVVLPTGPTEIECGECGASAVLTDPPNEEAKGWQAHPILGWRCPTHPWR